MDSSECVVVDGIDDVNENQWNNVVAQSDAGTVFQRTGWLRAIEDGLGYRPKHVVVRRDGNPVAVCPNFVSEIETPFDLPATISRLGLAQLTSVTPGYGGPVVAGSRDGTLETILEAVEDVCGWRSVYHRLRILDATHVQYAQTLQANGYRPSLLYCRHWLPLDDYQTILDGMDSGRRREIRNGTDPSIVVVEEPVTRDSLRSFYMEYRKTLDRVDGQAFPRSFFDALADHLADRIEIFTATLDGEPVGKHLYLRDDEQDSLHYFFSGVDEAYFEYSSPTHIHDYAFKWAIEEGYDTYDFGGTSASHRDGVFKYKEKFGTRMEPVYEWEKGQSLLRWNVFQRSRRRYLSELHA